MLGAPTRRAIVPHFWLFLIIFMSRIMITTKRVGISNVAHMETTNMRKSIIATA